MNIHRLACSLLITIVFAATAAAQVELPAALQGDPLEDKRVGGEPDYPFGPIHFFSMDGSIVDEVTGVRATSMEGVTHTNGYIDGAIQFNGDAIVQLPINLDIAATPDLTIIAMVEPEPLPDDPELVDEFYNTGYVFSDGEGLVWLSNHNKDIPYFAALSNKAVISNSDHPGMRGGWQMVALTRKIEDRTTEDGAVEPHVVLSLFTNGRTSEAVKIYKEKTVTPQLLLGSISSGSSSKFRGAIDHLMIYNRALPEDELQQIMGGLRRASSGQHGGEIFARSDASSDLVDGDGSGDLSYEDVGREQQFPGDMFDPDEQQFPGDMFDGDEQQFPGDMFEGDEEQFPGDMFEGSESSASSAQDSGDSPGPGSGGAITDAEREAFEDPARSPQQQFIDQMEEEARRDAAAGTAIDDSPLRDADASVFEPPLTTADETEELIDSKDGQAMLKTADWRIEGMVPNSADKKGLYPGDEVTVKIRISKDDPANKIPNVKLVTNVGPGTPSPSYDLTINTAEGKPTDEREIPITLPVPTNLKFAEGTTQMYWRPRVWLNAEDGRPLRDSIQGNHSKELAIVVYNNTADEQCDQAEQSADGARVARGCLTQDDVASKIYIDHSVLVSTNLPFAAGHENDAKQLLIIDGNLAPLRSIYIAETNDKPCQIRIELLDKTTKDTDHCHDSGRFPDILWSWALGDKVITGLMVCRNAANNRLKGFKLETRAVMEDGSLSSGNNFLGEKAHPNCFKWTAWSTCPAGSAAAGVEVRWSSGTRFAQRDFIHSIDLMCGAVKLRNERA